MLRLIKKYGIRRGMVLFGAAAVAAQRGWDALVSDDGYTRQGVWNWKHDLELAGIDPVTVEWTGFERKIGHDVGLGVEMGRERRRERKAEAAARAVRGRAAT